MTTPLPLLMGILNCTPDSFSDGGQFKFIDTALQQAEFLVENGAQIIDIGGVSSRPGAADVTTAEELQRILPIVQAIQKRNYPVALSIDTTRAVVAKSCLAIGATIINDISSLQDPLMAAVVAAAQATIILMHKQGTPQTMQHPSHLIYHDVVIEVAQFLNERCQYAIEQGISREHIWLDPGLGFAKTTLHNLQLIRQLAHLKSLKQKIVLGPSRKAFLGALIDEPEPKKRDTATAAICLMAADYGADILRVHNTVAVAQALKIRQALLTLPQ